MNLIIVLVILGLCYIAVDHTILLVKSRQSLSRNWDEGPIRYIFGYSNDEDYNIIKKFINIVMGSHQKANISIIGSIGTQESGLQRIVFDNENEIWIVCTQAIAGRIRQLNEAEIAAYNNRIFLPYTLPFGADRELIESFGLINYLFQIGYCS